ncbi:hypothetical protein [Cupriavidus nantongensis]|uniref:Uncharacterized protein n=1 Tax=Cupriavidus nantongensis TaxID=1796606 RepID=A0A142JHT4_9BURK|nr:hypothetical protein [Cupriavidus nantongensis]AMR77646.1 hypothetical protein A2G96_07800 [Cupriavidus nantongensis]
MTISELRDALDQLMEAGKGEMPVTFAVRGHMDDVCLEYIEVLEIRSSTDLQKGATADVLLLR